MAFVLVHKKSLKFNTWGRGQQFFKSPKIKIKTPLGANSSGKDFISLRESLGFKLDQGHYAQVTVQTKGIMPKVTVLTLVTTNCFLSKNK